MDKKISVVIPLYNNWTLCHQLLFDIYQYNNDVDEIVLVNDAAENTEKEVYDGVKWWRESLLKGKLRMVENEFNLGFLKTCNYGVEKAKGDIIILVSTDVHIQENITSVLRGVLGGKLVLGGVYYDRSTGWNEFKNGKNNKVFFYLEGWLLIFTKDGWNDAGGFDERFAPNDYEDIDICTTWLSKGYTLRPLSYSTIRHLGAQTIKYSPEREALTKRNRKKFAEKWKVTIP